MPCGREGNRRSGVTLAMRHRLQWFIHLRAHGLDSGVWPHLPGTCGWMQMLTVHLEETDCFAAWVSAREVGIGQPTVDTSDPKCMLSHFIVFSLVSGCLQPTQLSGLPVLSNVAPLSVHRKVATDNTHTHPFNGPLSGTTRVSQYQKGKTSLDFTEARDSELQWRQLGHKPVCTSLQIDDHTSTPPLSFLQVLTLLVGWQEGHSKKWSGGVTKCH